MAKAVKAPQILGRSDKWGQFWLAPWPKYCPLPFPLYLLPVLSPSSTTERTVLDCTAPTLLRDFSPCSEENTFLFWLAHFYSQCLCLTLLTVLSLLEPVSSHPAVPSGSCCDPEEAQLVPQSCLTDCPVQESRVPGHSAAPADRHSQGPDLPPQEATTSHHVLMLATFQIMGKPGNFSGFKIWLWLETQKTLMK